MFQKSPTVYSGIYSFYCLRYGTLCIRENPGCLFIATNRDAVTHLTDAQEWAGLPFSNYLIHRTLCTRVIRMTMNLWC